MNKRLPQLDSLRGLAALSVLLYHYFLVFEVVYKGDSPNGGELCNNWFVFACTYTPLHVFWVGHEAVIFFFVLSGFVLALPYLQSSTPMSYGSYLVKRVFRIYPAYLCAIAVAIIANVCLYKVGTDGLPVFWKHTVGQRWQWDASLIWDHILLVGSFNYNRFIPPVWSLVYEMRISLLFPFIMYGVRFLDWKTNLAIGFLLAGLDWWTEHLRFYGSLEYDHDYFKTFGYVGFFILGAVLAKNRAVIIEFFERRNRASKYLLLALGVLAYTHVWWLTRSGLLGHGRLKSLLERPAVAEWGMAAGITVFIFVALSSHKASGVLTNVVPQFLGKISYSLYLYHLPCLVTLLNLLSGRTPIWIILIISFVASIIVSTLSYFCIEIPFINVGRALTKRRVPE